MENTTPNAPVSAFPAGDVFRKLKNFRTEFLDLAGKSRRGEYWATYVCLALPIGIIAAIPALIFGILAASGVWPAAVLVGNVINPLFAIVTSLIIFPVMTRRVHDIGLTGWIAAAVTVLTVAVVNVPFLCYFASFVTTVLFIVIGCLPGKAEAPACTENTKVIGLVTVAADVALALLNALVCAILLVLALIDTLD